MNSRSFNLHRDSSNSLTLSNVGELSWSWIPEKPYPSSEWERKFHSSLFTPSIKREIRHFLVVVVQWRQRNVQKSVIHVQSCCFANLNPLLFWSSRCRRRRRILRSPLFEVACSYSHRFYLLCCVLAIWRSPLRYCVQLQKRTVLGDKFTVITRNSKWRGLCSSCSEADSQLVCYPNRKTMVNNELLLFRRTNQERPSEQLLQHEWRSISTTKQSHDAMRDNTNPVLYTGQWCQG